jgi:hypothetical protein
MHEQTSTDIYIASHEPLHRGHISEPNEAEELEHLL